MINSQQWIYLIKIQNNESQSKIVLWILDKNKPEKYNISGNINQIYNMVYDWQTITDRDEFECWLKIGWFLV